MKKQTRVVFLVFVLSSLGSSNVFAHKGHHEHHDEPAMPPDQKKKEADAFKQIGEAYVKNIQPIFKNKCMDCHGDQTRFPWYYKIPGAKQLIDSDIKTAKEHLDLSQGYPFKSHATPLEDLDAIRDVTQDGSMPPFRYRILHSGSALSKEEKKAVFDWAKDSKDLLLKK